MVGVVLLDLKKYEEAESLLLSAYDAGLLTQDGGLARLFEETAKAARDPKGAAKLLVVLPVFWLTFHIVWKYREGAKKKAKYTPNWDNDNRLEAVWWLLPLVLITILSAVLGGIDPFGGFGRIAGLMISMVILQVISSGLNLLGVNQHLTLAI